MGSGIDPSRTITGHVAIRRSWRLSNPFFVTAKPLVGWGWAVHLVLLRGTARESIIEPSLTIAEHVVVRRNWRLSNPFFVTAKAGWGWAVHLVLLRGTARRSGIEPSLTIAEHVVIRRSWRLSNPFFVTAQLFVGWGWVPFARPSLRAWILCREPTSRLSTDSLVVVVSAAWEMLGLHQCSRALLFVVVSALCDSSASHSHLSYILSFYPIPSIILL